MVITLVLACDMDKIMSIANKHGIIVIEDAAQAIDSYYISKDGTKKALGSIGHLSAFSFHETKKYHLRRRRYALHQ